MEKITPKCRAFIVGQLRRAWRYYSNARKECLKAKRCVSCKQGDRKLFADHKEPIGRFVAEDNPYIERLFCDSSNLQPLCKEDHDAKTKAERKARKKK